MRLLPTISRVDLSTPTGGCNTEVSLAQVECLHRDQPVANAIKLLQTCIYKSVNTGLFLISLVATIIVKFMLLMLDS